MKIAITGGCGFIGSRVAHEARSRHYEVTIIDRSVGIDLLADPKLLRTALDGSVAVIHLAGVLGTSELFQNPEEAIDVNVKGTARLLNLCAEMGIQYTGITMPSVWNNVYQATKRAAKDLATAWHQHQGLDVAHVRAYNVFGPGQKVGSPQKIIPTFSDHAWRKEAIPIWGDGTQTVDLVSVFDVARMLLDATHFRNDEVFDAGTGEALTVNQVASTVWKLINPDGTFQSKHLPMRPGEHEAKVVADGEGWDQLDWRPQFVLDDLRETVNSYRPDGTPEPDISEDTSYATHRTFVI